MNRIDVFGDGRKTPKISVNVKIKVKTSDINETVAWNKAFGYIMKKQRTKLEFLAVDSLRCLSLDKVKLKDIANFITEEDYAELSPIEKIFDKRLTSDVKAFILAILKVSNSQIENIIAKIIVERLNDGQLADSPLTLKDLKVIASTFSRILRGMQHNRIKYQENIAEEFAKNKIEMPNKILDEDFEKKIKELEDKNHTDLNTDNKKDL